MQAVSDPAPTAMAHCETCGIYQPEQQLVAFQRGPRLRLECAECRATDWKAELAAFQRATRPRPRLLKDITPTVWRRDAYEHEKSGQVHFCVSNGACYCREPAPPHLRTHAEVAQWARDLANRVRTDQNACVDRFYIAFW